ncbi:MAG: hypothetical protein ACYC27_05630 [Armatimonadota bacterium]
MSEERSPEDILDVNKAWLPPAPNAERVAGLVQAGRAYIEHRGHNLPPLVVFEDGGVIELPNVRYAETYRGMETVSAVDLDKSEQTRHPDVCGCVDEFKGLIGDNPDIINEDPEKMHLLLDDASYMISRMRKRLDAYHYFAAKVIEVCLTIVESPDPEQSTNAANALHEYIDRKPGSDEMDIDELYRLAEDVRDVASRQEAALAKYKDLAIQVGELYQEIKGARNWDKV